MRDTMLEAFEILQKNSPIFDQLPIYEQEDAATEYASTTAAYGIDPKKYSDRQDAE